MKKSGYKAAIWILGICFPLLVAASGLPGDGNNWNGRYSKEKKIKKSFNVNSDALLSVSNSYGNIHITSWNETRVEIDVHIKTNGNNEEKVQQKLDEIDVVFEAGKSAVSAKTVFNHKKGLLGRISSSNISMEINYTIKLPANNRINLSNDYGGIRMDRINGKAKINCNYGKLDIGELHADDNELSFDYTSKSSIGYMKGGRINADYSGFVLEKAGNVTLNADYTTSEFRDVKSLAYSCDYGTLTVGNAGNIRGTGDYLTARFGILHGNVEITSDYGSIKIDELAADAGNVSITSDYTGVKIGFNSSYSFNFEVKLDYASFKGDSDFEYTIKRVKNTEKYFKGHYGRSPKNNVSIKSEYGGVSLYKK